MNTNDPKTAEEALTKSIHRARHAMGDVEVCLERYKASINKPACSEADRRDVSTVEETIRVVISGEDQVAKLKYPDGEKPSTDTREDKKDLSMIII